MSKSVYRMRMNPIYRSYSYDQAECDTQALVNREFPARKERISIQDWWQPVNCFACNPGKKCGDFFGAGQIGRFGVSDCVFNDPVARGVLEQTGELLPLEVPEENRRIYFYRLVKHGERTDTLDEAKSVMKNYFDLKPVFFSDRLPEGGCFCLPREIDVFAVHDPAMPAERDFVQWYQKMGYTGLDFELMWTEDPQ